MSITGYYDGNAVQTDAQLKVNQKVIIIPIDETYVESDSAGGSLKEYANPDLISSENMAWLNAVKEQYGK